MGLGVMIVFTTGNTVITTGKQKLRQFGRKAGRISDCIAGAMTFSAVRDRLCAEEVSFYHRLRRIKKIKGSRITRKPFSHHISSLGIPTSSRIRSAVQNALGQTRYSADFVFLKMRTVSCVVLSYM